MEEKTVTIPLQEYEEYQTLKEKHAQLSQNYQKFA